MATSSTHRDEELSISRVSPPCGGCNCCPDARYHAELMYSRRSFLSTTAASGIVLGGLSWLHVARASELATPMPKSRTALRVLPVLVWDEPVRRPMTSWRNWGGIHTANMDTSECQRIDSDLAGIASSANFPVTFDKCQSAHNLKGLAGSKAVGAADLVIVYGAGGAIQQTPRDEVRQERVKHGYRALTRSYQLKKGLPGGRPWISLSNAASASGSSCPSPGRAAAWVPDQNPHRVDPRSQTPGRESSPRSHRSPLLLLRRFPIESLISPFRYMKEGDRQIKLRGGRLESC